MSVTGRLTDRKPISILRYLFFASTWQKHIKLYQCRPYKKQNKC